MKTPTKKDIPYMVALAVAVVPMMVATGMLIGLSVWAMLAA